MSASMAVAFITPTDRHRLELSWPARISSFQLKSRAIPPDYSDKTSTPQQLTSILGNIAQNSSNVISPLWSLSHTFIISSISATVTRSSIPWIHFFISSIEIPPEPSASNLSNRCLACASRLKFILLQSSAENCSNVMQVLPSTPAIRSMAICICSSVYTRPS
jgi:hypothetical protein